MRYCRPCSTPTLWFLYVEKKSKIQASKLNISKQGMSKEKESNVKYIHRSVDNLLCRVIHIRESSSDNSFLGFYGVTRFNGFVVNLLWVTLRVLLCGR
jgi:hypothetical protein